MSVRRHPPLLLHLVALHRPRPCSCAFPRSTPTAQICVPSLNPLLTFHSPFQIIASLDEDPAAQSKQLTLRLQQIAAALENKVTDL